MRKVNRLDKLLEPGSVLWAVAHVVLIATPLWTLVCGLIILRWFGFNV